MPLLEDDAAGSQLAEPVVEPVSMGLDSGPPMRIAVPEPVDEQFLGGRLDWLFARSRPALLGLVMLAAIGASIWFAWQSRLGAESEFDEVAGAEIAITPDPAGVSIRSGDQIESGSGRSEGDFDSSTTAPPRRSALNVAGPINSETVDLDTFWATTTTSESTSTSSTARRSTTASTNAPTTAAPVTSTTTRPTTASTAAPTTAAPTTAAPTTAAPTTTTTRPTTTTTRPTTTTTTRPTTTSTTLGNNPVGQYQMVSDRNGSCVSGQGFVVDEQPCGSDSNQSFHFETVGDAVRIVEARTGEVLDVEGGSYSDGARVIVYPWHGGSNQLWYVETDDDGHRVRSKKTGLCLTGWAGETGRSLYQSACDGRSVQRWNLAG